MNIPLQTTDTIAPERVGLNQRNQRVRKLASALFGGLVVLGLLVAFVEIRQSTASQTEPPTASLQPTVVSVALVRIIDQFQKQVSFLGRVEAARASDLSFERAGRVQRVFVEEGETVEADQVLAELDTDKLVAERAVMTARLAAATARLDELVAGPREEAIAAQRAEVDRLAADLQRAKLRSNRQDQLLRKSATSKTEFEDAFYSAASTSAALNFAKQQLRELENGTRSERILTQRSLVKQIQAEIASVDVDIEKSQLRAPYAGKISARRVDEGKVVAASESVVGLLELARPELRVGIDTDTARLLKIGQTHPVIVGDRQFLATVKAIRSDVDDRTRTVDVLLTFPAETCTRSHAIRDGDLAEVNLSITSRDRGTWLPLAALTEGSRGLWSVFVMQSDTARSEYVTARRDVEVLHTAKDQVFVRGALRTGDQVVTTGTHRLVPGQSVRAASVSGITENSTAK